MKEQPIEYEHTCYVLLRTNKINPIAYHRHDLLWYPESAMSLLDQVQYRPYVKSVVTECPWIISCYEQDNVRVWDGKRWDYPDRQTYGASVNHIMMTMLGITQTIPSTPLDGGERIRELIKELEK